MKFVITMKTPDALEDALNEMADDERHDGEAELDEDRQEKLDDVISEARRFAEKYFRYGEYLSVEFDTDAQTATVIPAR